MAAVVARHAEKSELFSAGGRAHPTNERNKLAAKALAMSRLVLFRFGNRCAFIDQFGAEFC